MPDSGIIGDVLERIENEQKSKNILAALPQQNIRRDFQLFVKGLYHFQGEFSFAAQHFAYTALASQVFGRIKKKIRRNFSLENITNKVEFVRRNET